MNRLYTDFPNNRTLGHFPAQQRKARIDALPYPLTNRSKRPLGFLMMVATQILNDLTTRFFR